MRCVLESSGGLSKGEVDDQGWEETDLVGSSRTLYRRNGDVLSDFEQKVLQYTFFIPSMSYHSVNICGLFQRKPYVKVLQLKRVTY